MKNIKLMGILICFILLFTSCPTEIDSVSTAPVTDLQTVIGNESVVLTWTNPTDYDFDHVEITATPIDTTLQSVTAETTNKITTTYTLTGLSNGKEYQIIVKALDIIGNKSISSNQATIIPRDSTIPTTVKEVSATSTKTSIVLNWENPTDLDFDHVLITATPIDTELETISCVTTNKNITAYTVPDLTSEKEYKFILKAIDTSGNKSIASDEIYSIQTATIINPPSWIIGGEWWDSGSWYYYGETGVSYNCYQFFEDNIINIVADINYKELLVSESDPIVSTKTSSTQFEIVFNSPPTSEEITLSFNYITETKLFFFRLQDNNICGKNLNFREVPNL